VRRTPSAVPEGRGGGLIRIVRRVSGTAEQDPPPAAGGAYRALVAAWVEGATRPIFLPLDRTELTAFLHRAARTLLAAGTSDPVDLVAARAVGSSLADAGLVTDDVLPATAAALVRHLPGALAAHGAPRPEQAAAALHAAVVTGYVASLRARILAEQESVRRAEAEARRQAEEALRSSEARFRAIFASSAIGIGIADMSGRIVEVNTAFATMLGYTTEEFRSLRVTDFDYPDDADGMWELYRELIAGERDSARVEKRYRHRDGHLVWTDLTASLIRGADGTPLYTVAMAEDVTRRRELQERLRQQALHDPLTLLPNRTLFQDRLAAAFARPGTRVGVCYLDLDRFKAVNDRLGHHVGDALLVAVAQRLGTCVAARGHLVARMGGDEFVLLVEDPPPGELEGLAAAVLAALATPVEVGEHRLGVSASIGVVETRVEDTTPAEVLKAADVTLYWAKADGRNRWARFDPQRHARDMTRYTLSATLLPGLHRDEFVVEYQPIVRLADEATCGVEALVRWAHPTFGRLGPDQFIGLAEETGAIVPLGHRVLSEACARGAAWNAAHPDAPLVVSVNLAVRQAQEAGLVEDVAAVLDRTGLPAHLLQLELTESALLGPVGRPIEAITALAEAGVRIAVDDFGTGYSNLGYLSRLPLRSLKLAGTLVEGLGTGGADAVVRSLVGLAHALGLDVTAEGVETPDQARRLAAAGCDTAQGWLYAKPAPWASLVDGLERRRSPGS
jgi:diguanylate cyclase (GGDEF)-like protein/PAS domain S-box-containing protein